AANLASALRPCRSCRPGPVPRTLLHELLEAATYAPSNFNRQPWQFILADESRSVNLLADMLGRRVRQFKERSLPPGPLEAWPGFLDSCQPAALAQSP